MMNETSSQDANGSTWELVNIVLTNPVEDALDAPYWNAIRILHERGTAEGFQAARSLCESPCPFEQRMGCNILAQLGGRDMPFASASFPVVVSIIRKTEDLDTLACALCALGWFGDPRGVGEALPFLNHPYSGVRYWVTQVLTALCEDPRSIDGLICLTSDAAVEVRDWATFGLGSMTDQDTPAIRQALLARLADPDDIVRGEALVGLAKRQDQRVVEPLRQALESGIYENGISDYAGEALEALHDLEEYPQLLLWKSND